MYHTEPPTHKTIREWYINSSRVDACALQNEQAVRAHVPGRLVLLKIGKNFPKHVDLTGIINKPLLLHLAGCLYYLYQ